MPEDNHNQLLALTAQIVAAQLGKTAVPADDIPAFMQKIYRALAGLGTDNGALGERPQPAVAVKKSIMPDYLICLEDGKKLKMLKRHLKSSYGLSPEQYRERWGLPADYPMVAPNYAQQRSHLAKKIGLGTTGRGGKK